MTDMIPAWVDGKLTPVEKLEVHRRGLRHKAVSVFVMARDKVLIQRRALTKYHTPGLWANTCCTHPLWNESAADCAVRRLDEELGITGLYPSFRDQVEYRAGGRRRAVEHEVVDIFIADAPRDAEGDARSRRGGRGPLDRPLRPRGRGAALAGTLHALAADLSRRAQGPDLRLTLVRV
jgi:isopentenyl-diphosphate delta-isomerase type 1